jgi:hypothetical protein
VDEDSSAAGDLSVSPKAEQMPAFVIAWHQMTSGGIQHGRGDGIFVQGDPASQTLHFAKQSRMLFSIAADVRG